MITHFDFGVPMAIQHTNTGLYIRLMLARLCALARACEAIIASLPRHYRRQHYA